MDTLFKFVVFAAFAFRADGLHSFEAFALMWQKNVDATNAFACERPQPRAYKAASLLKDIAASETVIPHSTVLHRCDQSSGCCTLAHERCGPIEEHAVDLVFLVESSRSVRQRTYAGRNHTKCACGAADTIPKLINVAT